MAGPLSTVMPIKSVILYDNGYAIFQREATLVGKGHVDLYFEVGLVQSVLNSLKLSGPAADKVGNIAYEATKPSANVEINSKNPLADLLKKLKGNQIRLVCLKEDGQQQELIGRVLGVDTDLYTSSTDAKPCPHVTVLVDSTSLRTIPIHFVRSFVVLEPRTQQDIEYSLQLTKDDQQVDMQKISIFYNDLANPTVLKCQYGFRVQEWKSSYRMVVADNKFYLEGLAIVENTLEEDWNGVNVSLVVGAPTLGGGDQGSGDTGAWKLSIKTFDGSYFTISVNPKDSVMTVKEKIAKKKGYNVFSFNLIFAGKTIEEGRQLSDYTIGNSSTLHLTRKEAGALHKGAPPPSDTPFVMSAQHNLSYYSIDLPVTAQRKQKAIVPLLKASLEGQLVLLYDESIRRGSPLSAFLFENATGRILEGGSIQVSDSERFLGEGKLPTLHPGDESPPVPFCVDLAVEVVKQSEVSYLPYYFISIKDGECHMSRKKWEKTIYTITNKTEKRFDFLLNHFFIDDYELVREDLGNEQEEPVDITDRVYQFRFELGPKVDKKKFVVIEEISDVSTESVSSITRDKVDRLNRRKYIDTTTFNEMEHILSMKENIAAIGVEIYEKECEVREIKDTEARLRDNIDAVEGFNKSEASKYVKSLAAEEDRLKTVQGHIKAKKVARTGLEKELKEVCNKITFHRDLKAFKENNN